MLFRDDIDNAKAVDRRKALLDSLNAPDFNGNYRKAAPKKENRFSLRPVEIDGRYLSWPKLDELCKIKPLNGMMEKRSGGLINVDKDVLARRMQAYFNRKVSWEEIKEINPGLAAKKRDYDPEQTREKALGIGQYDPENIFEYLAIPFDVRKAYYTDIHPVWNRHRPDLWEQRSSPNKFLVSRFNSGVEDEGLPVFFSICIGDNGAQRGNSHFIPFSDVSGKARLALEASPNISSRARSYLEDIGKDLTDPGGADDLFYHVLAVACSPRYLVENEDGVRIDWVRVPLPADADIFNHSAALGKEIANLFNVLEGPRGKIKELVDALRGIGAISSNDLEIGIDLGVRANWGKRRGGKVMPGKGKSKSTSWEEDQVALLERAFVQAGILAERGFELLGEARDIYLNDTTYWRGVPEKVWEFRIGGHQILKKWLSYREKQVLGRDLEVEDAREFTDIAVRILAFLLLQDALDANYQRAKTNTYAWPRED